MPAATPSFPLPPDPTGHWTALSAPTCDDHSALWLDSHEVHTAVVPDSSERWKIWIGSSGSVTPGFWLAIAWSFHEVMVPMNIFEMVAPSSFRPLGTPWTLYAKTTAPN